MLSPRPDLLAPFAAFDFSDAPVIVAISGGSDSTALLLLLKSFLDQKLSAPPIVAVTVDHGLRAGSTDEARSVAALAASLGIEHRVLRWQTPKPKTGLPAAARLARYGLLAQTARQIGARMVLTGHTADDQAETVAMRQTRGPGPGLSGMAPATLFDGSVWIGRPLLTIRRAALRDYLASRQIAWSEDPTNADQTYERARMRTALRDPDADPRRIDALLAIATEYGGARRALGERAARLIDRHASKAAPGLFHLAPAFGDASDRTEAVHALRILLSVIGGVDHLIDEVRADALLLKLVGQPHRATLSRVLVVSRKDGIWLCRETRGLPQPGPASDGLIWDGRYRLTGRMDADSFVGTAGKDAASAPANPSLPSSMARAAAVAQPVVFAHIPSAHLLSSSVTDRLPPNWSAVPILAPWAAFLPMFDLVPAHAMAKLVGAPPPPDPPWADHIVTSP